ncbi:LOW QUALITY PROTEIN: toll-like receptor 6 [Amphiura filiformis]|uniref:LOW QUALITY PROTEIN: toll-like receptor 6 n=1 Tax=Amphiura filiformis TaxID=82378 RepID=UPI003B21D82B
MASKDNNRILTSRLWLIAIAGFLLQTNILVACDLQLNDEFSIRYPDYSAPGLPCKLSDIENGIALHCNNRQLQSISQSIGNFGNRNITKVNLSVNNLTSISARSFIRNKKLESIWLSANFISRIESHAFAELQSLRQLFLLLNHLSSLPANIFQDTPNLENLDLSFNKFTSIPYYIFQHLPSLEIFLIDGNDISSISSDEDESVPYLQPLNKLSTFSVTGVNANGSSLILSDTSFLLPVELEVSNIRELDLRYYHQVILQGSDVFRPLSNLSSLLIGCLSLDDIKQIGVYHFTNIVFECNKDLVSHPTVLGNQNLRHLQNAYILSSLSIIQHNIISVEDDTFSWTPFLIELSMTNNAITSISEYAFRGLNHLQVLDLSCNALRTIPSPALTQLESLMWLSFITITLTKSRMFRPFGGSRKLQHIDISSNSVSGRLPRRSFHIPSLKFLDLSKNALSDVWGWLENFQNLTTLNLTQNGFVSIPPFGWPQSEVSSPLKTLSISANDVTDDTHVNVDITSLVNSIPTLESLDLANSNPNCLNAVFKGSLGTANKNSSLKAIDISNNCLKSEDFDKIYKGYFHVLASLRVADNKLTWLKENTFEFSTAIETLDLSNNQISNVTEGLFKPLQNLKYLHLEDNSLVSVDALKGLVNNLVALYLAGNSLFEIPANFFTDNGHSSLQEIDLSGNNWKCTCDSIEYFKTWYLTDKKVHVLFGDLNYRCDTPAKLKGTVFTEVTLDCRPRWPLYVGSALTIVLFICACVGLAVHLRWRIRYKIFLLRVRLRRRYRVFVNDETELGSQTSYDGFVSYSGSDDDLNWIQTELLKHIEEGDEPMRLYFAARDELPGQSKFDAILEQIQRSRKTILLLSPSYMENEWCYFEMQMAHMRLFDESLDVIIPVLLQEIPDNKLTLLTRKLLLRQNCLKWTDDPVGQELFWGKLRDIMKKPSLVDRRFDVVRYNENRE